MGPAERVGPAPIDVVSLARSLRAEGAPITSDDIGDAARGLARLGTKDPDLVHAVLDATIGKYGSWTATRSGTGGRSDAPPLAPATAPVTVASADGAAATGHDDEGASISSLTDQPNRPTAPPGAGETISADVDPPAASLGLQTSQEGSARESSVELTGPEHSSPARLAPVGAADPPRPWALPSRRAPVPARPSTDSALDRSELVSATRRLAAHLDGRPSRRRPARAGSIDLHRTLVAARRRDGRLLPPARHRRGRRRPATALVVDVSPSVRGATALPIAVAHRLARAGRRTRVFAATDRLTEVTSVFRSRDPGIGLERAIAAADLDPTAASDWGRVLTQLDRSPAATAPNVHVVVLGDGRSVGATDGVLPLERITRRAASVRWATPEPTGAWSLGSGEPARYAEVVTTMVTVRTPADLQALEVRPSETGTK